MSRKSNPAVKKASYLKVSTRTVRRARRAPRSERDGSTVRCSKLYQHNRKMTGDGLTSNHHHQSPNSFAAPNRPQGLHRHLWNMPRADATAPVSHWSPSRTQTAHTQCRETLPYRGEKTTDVHHMPRLRGARSVASRNNESLGPSPLSLVLFSNLS